MKTKKLDRLLCERLGIKRLEINPGIRWAVGNHESTVLRGTKQECEAWYAAHEDWCGDRDYGVVERKVYPALSTTGDGMVKLMEALWGKGFASMVGQREGTHYDGAVGGYPVDDTASWAQADTAPIALALAAAKALGIEVPE